MNSICPWCDTELVWDEELGPEEHCPHCLSELGDYRTIPLGVLQGEDDPQESEISLDALDYEQALEEFRETQGEIQEYEYACSQCHEYMIYAGVQTVGHDNQYPFIPAQLPGKTESLLNPSFSLQVHICPTCFQLNYSLAKEDRKGMIQALMGKVRDA